MSDPVARTDLRTAQNSVHGFLDEVVAEARATGTLRHLVDDRTVRGDLALRTEERLLDLLALRNGSAAPYRMAISDSGKRAIEVMVNAFCSSRPDQTVAMPNENYVGHNKWSAATALQRLKGVPFLRPFELDLSKALTVDSPAALDRAKELIESNVETLYIAWNATSTGVLERPEQLVRHRDATGSGTLILVDASSLDILSTRWAHGSNGHAPDAFFFSFRKHTAIPYEGPQDEIEQMKNSGAVLVFNERALERARHVQADPVYGVSIEGPIGDRIPPGEKHTTHLFRLTALLDHVLADGGSRLREIDATGRAAKSEVMKAFAPEGRLGKLGFELFADPAVQSSTTYVIRVPSTIKAAELVKRLESDAEVVISPALHPLANTKNHNLLRFGVYSATTLAEVQTGLDGLTTVAQAML